MSAATEASARSVFADLMRLTPVGVDDFVAPLAPESAGRMYGGQLLAQGADHIVGGNEVCSHWDPRDWFSSGSDIGGIKKDLVSRQGSEVHFRNG